MPDTRSLYRRYRPQRFAEVLGQEHVTRRPAQRRSGTAGSPTPTCSAVPAARARPSTARILARPSTASNPQDGEPGGDVRVVRGHPARDRRSTCWSWTPPPTAGSRTMRDLVSRVALGTPGRWKVYIVDEVHLLTARRVERPAQDPGGAARPRGVRAGHHRSAEGAAHHPQPDPAFRVPPARPRAVVVPAADVNDRADLGLAPDAIDRVVRRGNGSARDALSALDQVAAAGGVEDEASRRGRHRRRHCRSRSPAGFWSLSPRRSKAGLDPRRLGRTCSSTCATGSWRPAPRLGDADRTTRAAKAEAPGPARWARPRWYGPWRPSGRP